MHVDLEAGLERPVDNRLELVRRDRHQAPITGLVRVVLEERRSARAERAVDADLDGRDL